MMRKAKKLNKGYAICPDCEMEYKIGAPHSGFCAAKTCDDCGNTVGYVLEVGAIEADRRICDRCADKMNFPEDFEDDD